MTQWSTQHAMRDILCAIMKQCIAP